MNSTMKMTLIASSVALALGSQVASAVGMNDIYGDVSFTTTYANFTMLDSAGGVVGGTNDVLMTWDGDAFTSDTDYVGPGSYSNVTATSTAPFFGHTWTAHDIQVFTPGTYSFDTALAGGNPESGILTATVNTGQVGMHMLFDWNGSFNIDVFVVANPSSIFGSGLLYSTQTNTKGDFKCDTKFTGTLVKNCLYDGPYLGGPAPTKDQVWMLASGDGNGDGVMGIPMAAGGPFPGFNANFMATMSGIADISDITAVPVPAAAWLLGSGLVGLAGIARRNKKA